MPQIGAVSPEMMEQIVRYVTRQIASNVAQSSEQNSDEGIFFINTTGEEIPPYGVFQAHETRNDVFMPAIVIAKKPIDATANASAIFVNGPNAVENNGFGYAQPGPMYKVLHDGTAAAGDDLGLTDDSFEASPGSGPFVALGEDDVAPNVFLCLMNTGGSSRWFLLAEDITSTTDEEVYVWFGKLETGVTPVKNDAIEEPVLLTNVGYCLSPSGKLARAGYYGRMTREGAKWVPISTYECLTACTPSGGASITQPTFTDATVDSAYSFEIETTGSVTGLACANLPDGLTFSGGFITGTPTTAGHKWVTITGTSGDCTITKLAKLTVLEAE